LRKVVTCGRRPRKNFLTFWQPWSGCGHVSGLLMRRVSPLALARIGGLRTVDRHQNCCLQHSGGSRHRLIFVAALQLQKNLTFQAA
jgi:hypothetical protein